MVLLADAYYDAYDFLEAVTNTGASFLLRSTRKRRPTVRRPLPDGSYLTTVCAGRYQAGRGYGRLEVRIIEAWMTIELADGTRRTELWRLMTSLLDSESYLAHELVTLYHRRWQAETCYFSLKSTVRPRPTQGKSRAGRKVGRQPHRGRGGSEPGVPCAQERGDGFTFAVGHGGQRSNLRRPRGLHIQPRSLRLQPHRPHNPRVSTGRPYDRGNRSPRHQTGGSG